MSDLSYEQWPELAAESGLTTLGIHPWPENALVNTIEFVNSDSGAKFLAKCNRLGLQLEYEIHAIGHLLPRELFDNNPELFRMNEDGVRVADVNMCATNPVALAIAAENAAKLCSKLKSTTGRYFLWGSDNYGKCECRKCRELSGSEQALIIENALLKSIRSFDSRATLAHLAYCQTASAPRAVAPDDGIFLEFAPMHRRHDIPFSQQSECEEALSHLDDNLKVFGAESAQVLEYWLDASLFSNWKKPAAKIPWSDEVLAADLQTYAQRGIRNVQTFACFVDADYIAAHGEPPVRKYGRALANF